MDFFEECIDAITANTLIDYLISLIIILSFTILGHTISSCIIRLFHIKEKRLSKIKKHAFYKPLKRFISILGIYIALKLLYLPPNISLFIDKTFRVLTILLISHAFANLFNVNSNSYESIQKLVNLTGNDALLSFIAKLLKTIIYVIAGFIIVNEFGYDLSGLVAGLGIFSAVVALAAQDLAKNVIAGFSIITDKPFSIGDFIEVDTLTGTVEDITFRSTRIRNTNNQLIVMPNSQVTNATLINHNKMEKRRFLLTVTLDLSTDLNKVLALTEKIKALLLSNDNILHDNIKTYFNTISANGIDIVIDFYTSIIDYMNFLQFKHEMNYEILDLIQKENITLAYNTQTIYVKQ